MENSNIRNQILDFDNLDSEAKELIRRAVDARKQSYCPYSKFAVGAAVKTSSGEIFTGCNVESKVFSPSVCAERTAICKAVSEGFRSITHVAVVACQENSFTAPCGVCREFMSEFGKNNLDVYMSKPDMNKVLCMKLDHLLPLAFIPDFLSNI